MSDKLTIEGSYQVIITGLPVFGTNLAQVRENFKKQFNLPEEKVKTLFSGKNIMVRKDLSWEEGLRYRDQMKRLGALCEILPQEEGDTRENEVPSFPCPKCRNLQTGDICSKCGFDVRDYRIRMRSKGFVEIPGTGYIKERRDSERRSGDDRRDDVRYEDGRRAGKDRRLPGTGWDET